MSCPNAPPAKRQAAKEELMSGVGIEVTMESDGTITPSDAGMSSLVGPKGKKRKTNGGLESFVDRAMTEAEKRQSDLALLRYVRTTTS
jgi:hypothetical protein